MKFEHYDNYINSLDIKSIIEKKNIIDQQVLESQKDHYLTIDAYDGAIGLCVITVLFCFVSFIYYFTQMYNILPLITITFSTFIFIITVFFLSKIQTIIEKLLQTNSWSKKDITIKKWFTLKINNQITNYYGYQYHSFHDKFEKEINTLKNPLLQYEILLKHNAYIVEHYTSLNKNKIFLLSNSSFEDSYCRLLKSFESGDHAVAFCHLIDLQKIVDLQKN